LRFASYCSSAISSKNHVPILDGTRLWWSLVLARISDVAELCIRPSALDRAGADEDGLALLILQVANLCFGNPIFPAAMAVGHIADSRIAPKSCQIPPRLATCSVWLLAGILISLVPTTDKGWNYGE
jgi:hypothetical protein